MSEEVLSTHVQLTNSYARALTVVSGPRPIDSILSRCTELEPALLEGYRLSPDGMIKPESILSNLSRIHREERERAIYRTFARVDSALLRTYERVVSPRRALELLDEESKRSAGKPIRDYLLPAILFKVVLQPPLMECGSPTLGAVMERLKSLLRIGPSIMYENVLELLAMAVTEDRLRTFRKIERVVEGLKIQKGGTVDLEGVYLELSRYQPKERVERCVGAFTAVLQTIYPELERGFGIKRTREFLSGASARIFGQFPEIRKMMVKELPKPLRRKFEKR